MAEPAPAVIPPADPILVERIISVHIERTDSEKRLVFGEVAVPIERYEPGQVVSEAEIDGKVHFDGRCWTAGDIETMAHRYIAVCRKMDQQHDHGDNVAIPVESGITREESEHYSIGGWWVGARVTDDDEWERVERGEHTGFSVSIRTKEEHVEVFVEREDGSKYRKVLRYLRDPHPKWVSLVDKPAAKKKWVDVVRSITSDEWDETEVEAAELERGVSDETDPPATDKEVDRMEDQEGHQGFFQRFMDWARREDPDAFEGALVDRQAQSSFADQWKAQKPNSDIQRAFYLLQDWIFMYLWEYRDNGLKGNPKTDVGKAINEFKVVVLEAVGTIDRSEDGGDTLDGFGPSGQNLPSLLAYIDDSLEAGDLVDRAGKKISKKRVTALKGLLKQLNEGAESLKGLLDEVDDDGEETNRNEEGIMDEATKKEMDDLKDENAKLVERIGKLEEKAGIEKEDPDPEGGEDTNADDPKIDPEVQKELDDIRGVNEKLVKQVERLENARPPAQGGDDATRRKDEPTEEEVERSMSDSFIRGQLTRPTIVDDTDNEED